MKPATVARALLRQGDVARRAVRPGQRAAGFVTIEPGGVLQTTALLIEDGKIAAIYVMRNPDKLRHLGEAAH